MQRISNSLFRLLGVVLVLAMPGFLQVARAQNVSLQQDAAGQHDTTTEPPAPVTHPLVSATDKAGRIETNSTALVLVPGDELDVTVYGATDLSGHNRVSADGNISMPLIGYVRVAGLSSSEAEGAIEAKLRQNHVVLDPQVSV